ncbi:MAG TPA: hypothetical protein VEW42_02005 [Candidatus Eisenbacteria bacterium]|nr:hypothetical protein [Candidatus Eisenbacteria bacterium]
MTTDECGGYGKAEKAATGVRITTGCIFPDEQCDLKRRGLCPKTTSPTFTQLSEETGGKLSARQLYEHAGVLLPQFSDGATRAVRSVCKGRHRPT